MAKSHSYKANVLIYIHIDKRFTHIFVTEKSGMKFQVGIARFYWDYRDDGERHVIHTRMIIIIFYQSATENLSY